MSYPAPDTGNAMNDLFTRLSDFHQLAWHLDKAGSDQEFHVWLEKLLLIDRRSTVLYLEAHLGEIPAKRRELAQLLCGTALSDGKPDKTGG